MRRSLFGGALMAALLAQDAVGQGDCFPASTSNEAQTFGIFSVALAFSPTGIPSAGSRRVQVGLELSYLPNVDSAIARPTVCRPGKEPENTDLLFAAPRPRITVALGGGFAVEGSWIPPIRLNQVRANLVGVALSYDARLGHRGAGLTLRAHGTFGEINAPITCSDEALQNSVSECFRGTRSDDSFKPNILGGEAMVHWSLGPGQVHPYLGVGFNRLMPRFQVNFVNSQNQLDNRRVEVDLNRLALFGGLSWMASPRWAVSGEVYSAPSDAVTARMAIRVGL